MILVKLTSGADGYAEGDVMTLGDAQKLRKQLGVQYEDSGTDHGRWRSLDCQADPRLQPDLERSAGFAAERQDGLRAKQVGGVDPDEAVARVGKKRGRPARRS